MKYVYVISPDFLRAIVKESMDYSFSIKGYCSIEQGGRNLIYTNIADILGFVIALDELPEELAPLINILNTIDTISDYTPIVLWVRNVDGSEKKGIQTILEYVNLNSSRLFVFWESEDLTDKVIRRELFGPIIKSCFKPYELNKKDFIAPPQLTMVKYKPLFNKRISDLFKYIPQASDCRKAIMRDVVCNTYESDKIIYLLRCAIIYKSYGQNIPNEKSIATAIEDISSSDDRLLFMSIFNIINRGDIKVDFDRFVV